MSKNSELASYLKGNSDSLSDLADDLEKEANEMFGYHCGEMSCGIAHIKGIYGIVGLLRYISDYMREHSNDASKGEFYIDDREKLEKEE